jgi:two-component system phosphate regulon response regulator PhoB
MAFDVLLLEDDDEIVAVVRQILEEEGISIRAVLTGVEAFAAAMDSRPDLVIADVGMRGGESRKLYQVMQHLTAVRTVPFLFLGSTDESAGMREDNLILAADNFLAKPFLVSEFRDKVRRLREAPGEGGRGMPEGPTGTATCNVKEVLIDIIEFLVSSRRSGTLTVAAAGEEGLLAVEKGVLRHASFGRLGGEEALLRLLGLEGVEVNFREGDGKVPVPNLDIDWNIFVSSHC